MQVPDWNKSLIEKCQIANDTYLSICNALELSTLRSYGQDAAATLMFKMLRPTPARPFSSPASASWASTKTLPTR